LKIQDGSNHHLELSKNRNISKKDRHILTEFCMIMCLGRTDQAGNKISQIKKKSKMAAMAILKIQKTTAISLQRIY